MKRKEDLYVAMIRYGRERLEDGIHYNDLKDHLADCGYSFNEKKLLRIYREVFEPLEPPSIDGVPMDKTSDYKYTLSVDSLFKLIDYDEFKTAQKSSIEAIRWARRALVISIVALALSSGISIWQTLSDSKLSKSQFEQITAIQYQDGDLLRKIDELISAQNKQTEKVEELRKEMKAINPKAP